MALQTDTEIVARAAGLVAEAVAEALTALPREGLDRPTPCAEWDVRALVNHFAGTQSWMARTARREPPDPDDPFGQAADVTGGDVAALLAERIREVGEAWRAPSAWEGEIEGMGMPAAMIGRLALVEMLVHGWDLSAAAGSGPAFRASVPADLAAATLDFMAETAEMGRTMGAYTAEIAVDAAAPDLDRALGLAGRDPDWAPAG